MPTTTTITITLGTSSQGETPIPKADKVNFKNSTGSATILTTPQGMNPQGQTPIAVNETSRDFNLTANVGSSLAYGWTVPDHERATRGGTIKVT